MSDNWSNLDLKNLVSSLAENIKQFGGFSPEEVRQAAVWNDETLRQLILKATDDSAKTGAEIIEAITDSSRKAKPSDVYPLLESMVDEGLLTSTYKKDRRTYSITEVGRDSLIELPEVAEDDQESQIWNSPKWVDLRGVIPVAAGRLAKVSVEVAKFGTKEQQEAAAEVIEEATKKIHGILAE